LAGAGFPEIGLSRYEVPPFTAFGLDAKATSNYYVNEYMTKPPEHSEIVLYYPTVSTIFQSYPREEDNAIRETVEWQKTC
jgi:hypothetical protein